MGSKTGAWASTTEGRRGNSESSGSSANEGVLLPALKLSSSLVLSVSLSDHPLGFLLTGTILPPCASGYKEFDNNKTFAVDLRLEWWQKETPTGWWHIQRLGRVDTGMMSVRSKGLSTLWTHTQMHRLGFNTMWLITKWLYCCISFAPEPRPWALLINNLQRSPSVVSLPNYV